jgi:hypothetical protein
MKSNMCIENKSKEKQDNRATMKCKAALNMVRRNNMWTFVISVTLHKKKKESHYAS